MQKSLQGTLQDLEMRKREIFGGPEGGSFENFLLGF